MTSSHAPPKDLSGPRKLHSSRDRFLSLMLRHGLLRILGPREKKRTGDFNRQRIAVKTTSALPASCASYALPFEEKLPL